MHSHRDWPRLGGCLQRHYCCPRCPDDGHGDGDGGHLNPYDTTLQLCWVKTDTPRSAQCYRQGETKHPRSHYHTRHHRMSLFPLRIAVYPRPALHWHKPSLFTPAPPSTGINHRCLPPPRPAPPSTGINHRCLPPPRPPLT